MNIAGWNFPAAKYPFVVEFEDLVTGEVFFTIEVPGPGVMEVPAMRERQPYRVRLRFADGEVQAWPPDDWTGDAQQWQDELR